MIGEVRSWLLGLIAVSLVCALADALIPKGAVKRAGRLVCGLTLLAAVLTPLTRLDISGSQRWLEDYLASLSRQESELSETVDRQLKIIIEEECAAYIVDKAAELGCVCSARVECRAGEDGLYLPIRAEVAGALAEPARTLLARRIAQDLGIPEGQITIEEETP